LGQSRCCGSRSVNFHSILGDEYDQADDSEGEEDPQVTLEAYKLDWDKKRRDQNGKQGDNRFYKKPGMPSKQRTMIPRSKWNMLSHGDQIAWAKLSKEARRGILDTFDKEKGSNSNPVVVVNNHKIVFDDEDEEEDTTGNGNPSISAQTHSSSKQNMVASVHESNPAKRAIQVNTSTLQRGISEEKHQELEKRGLRYMATHKTTKSNKQIDVNSTFSKAIEKKFTGHVSWNNDIEQPTSGRYKKPQLQANMVSRKKVVF